MLTKKEVTVLIKDIKTLAKQDDKQQHHDKCFGIVKLYKHQLRPLEFEKASKKRDMTIQEMNAYLNKVNHLYC